MLSYIAMQIVFINHLIFSLQPCEYVLCYRSKENAGTMPKQKKKPSNKLETVKTIVNILAGIASIVKIISELLKEQD